MNYLGAVRAMKCHGYCCDFKVKKRQPGPAWKEGMEDRLLSTEGVEVDKGLKTGQRHGKRKVQINDGCV